MENTNNHILNLLRQYPELPLFIYSNLFLEPHQSYYSEYMILWNKINSGILDQEIESYMHDIIESYKNTIPELPEEQITYDIMWYSNSVIDHFNKWSSEPINHTFLTLRIWVLFTLVLGYSYNNFDTLYRNKEYVKIDIMKMCNEWNRVSQEVNSPDYKDLTTLLNEYDDRWDHNEKEEYGLNYNKQHLYQSEEYNSPILKLETELDRLKRS